MPYTMLGTRTKLLQLRGQKSSCTCELFKKQYVLHHFLVASASADSALISDCLFSVLLALLTIEV